jgi:transposase
MPGDSSRMAGFGGFTPHLASVESTPEDAIGVSDESMTFSAPVINERSAHMPKPDDLSRSFTAFEQDSTLIAIIGMSLTSWLVPGIVPGIERHPLKKLDVDEEALLQLLHRWRDEAINAGRKITRIVLAFEAGRDGIWLARRLRARNIETYVIHPNSVAVSREHRRAKTDPSSWAGCAANRIIAAWRRSPPSEKRTRGAPTASGKICWASARAS